MLKATLYIQRKIGDESQDDILRIYDSNYPSGDIYRLVYSTPELLKDRQFYMARSLVCNFVNDLLRSLSLDVEPFERVQVTTCIQPSVVFHTSDLDRRDNRHMIEDIITTAMRTDVFSA